MKNPCSHLSFIALVSFATSSFAVAEFSFSGAFDGDVAGYYNATDSASSNVEFQANHELNLTGTVLFSKQVRADLRATSYTQGPNGGTVPAQGSNAENRWSGFVFDGFVASIDVSDALALKLGDLSFSSGAFNYYKYKRTNVYASIMADRFFRGLQVNTMGLTLAAGTDSKYGYSGYAAYTLHVGASHVKPFVNYVGDQQENSKSLRAGLEASMVFGAQKLNLAAGILRDNGTKPTSTIKVEPQLTFGSIALIGTAFLAILDGDKPTPIDVPEYLFIYVEPRFALNAQLRMGLPLEFHTMTTDKKANLEELWMVPTLYISLADDFNWSVWTQGSLRIGTDHLSNEHYFGVGSEAILNF